MTDQLQKVLSLAEAVLFDFDGPICSVFAGYPAPQVAADLRRYLEGLRPDVAWSSAGLSDDPMRVLTDTPAWGPDFAVAADDKLTELETVAVATARPTEGAAEGMRACRESRRAVAIVSNNSTSAIRRYLDEHSLTELVDGAIIGRRHGRPELMKPHPGPIEEALAALNVAPAAAVLIGDSVTDVIAARRAGIMCIGYANKTSKAQLLADADVVIADMRTLAERLRDSPLPE